MPKQPERTTFARVVFGRFSCNTWDEATQDPDGIDVVVVSSVCSSIRGECTFAGCEFGERDSSPQARIFLLRPPRQFRGSVRGTSNTRAVGATSEFSLSTKLIHSPPR